jgi:putative nucleotidyltransferase with HDIG domain
VSSGEWAAATAKAYLANPLPERWAHVRKVAERASDLADALGDEGELLHTAAWLHDVGYAPTLAGQKFHPLDGARFLRSSGADNRLAGLVAFHSAAATEAEVLGLTDELAEFTDERTIVRDLLWYADMTVGPTGEPVTFDQRIRELRERYPADHYVIRALDASLPERRAAVDRAERWIADHVK